RRHSEACRSERFPKLAHAVRRPGVCGASRCDPVAGGRARLRDSVAPRELDLVGRVVRVALLTLFTLAIAFNLMRGRAPDCRCFGQLHSSPVGWGTVVRNLVLAAFAALLVLQGPPYASPSD